MHDTVHGSVHGEADDGTGSHGAATGIRVFKLVEN